MKRAHLGKAAGTRSGTKSASCLCRAPGRGRYSLTTHAFFFFFFSPPISRYGRGRRAAGEPPKQQLPDGEASPHAGCQAPSSDPAGDGRAAIRPGAAGGERRRRPPPCPSPPVPGGGRGAPAPSPSLLAAASPGGAAAWFLTGETGDGHAAAPRLGSGGCPGAPPRLRVAHRRPRVLRGSVQGRAAGPPGPARHGTAWHGPARPVGAARGGGEGRGRSPDGEAWRCGWGGSAFRVSPAP